MSKLIDSIFNKLEASKQYKEASSVYDDDESEESVPVGLDGIMASTEKLLAVNKGVEDPDERDNLQFKKVFRTNDLIRERVKMDAGKLRRQLAYRVSKHRNLKPVHSFYFDPYTEQHLLGSALSSPLEEINPMQLVEQARRMTLMGPGGLGSEQAITEDAQALNTSQFGFFSSLEGPESSRAGIDTRMAEGSKVGRDGKIYQRYYDRRKKRHVWLSAQDLDGLVVKLPE